MQCVIVLLFGQRKIRMGGADKGVAYLGSMWNDVKRNDILFDVVESDNRNI